MAVESGAQELDCRFLEVLSPRFAPGTHEALHTHPHQGQLKWASEGVVSVPTPLGVWVVPPGLAVWIPPGTLHGGVTVGAVSIVNVLVTTSKCGGWPDVCCCFKVSPLLREALIAAAALRSGYGKFSREDDECLVALLSRQLADTTIAPVQLPLEMKGLLGILYRALWDNPKSRSSLSVWAELVGLSARGLSDLVLRRTGMSFGTLRTRIRLVRALEVLAQGKDVAHAAQSVGYRSPSAFVQMFRRQLGTTPGRYFVSPTGQKTPE